MKILIYGLNFHPEKVGIGKFTGEMAEWLSQKGHEVKVITSQPYYPEWKLKNKNRYQFELKKGVKIIRCPIWVPLKPNGVKRLIHLLSFAITSLPVILNTFFWKPRFIINIVRYLFYWRY